MSIDTCPHIPEQLKEFKKHDEYRQCDCKKDSEYVCAECGKGICSECKLTHEHPIIINIIECYCNKCEKNINLETNEKLKEYQNKIPQFLPYNTQGVGMFLKHKKPKNIIIMAGAGISTAAGIPDFRTPGTGLYDNLQSYNLPFPEAVFEINFFDKNPQPFYTLAKELMPGLGKYFPTITHYFLSFLIHKKMVLKYFTQNIDGLEVQAGIDLKDLVLAHGHYYTGKCRQCKLKVDQSYFMEDVRNGTVCKCKKCNGVIKPDIVFFGENLPKEFFENLDLFPKCDCLIVLGTSLTVYPFADLVQQVTPECPRIFINLSDVNGFRYPNDIKVLRKTDEAVIEIADYMGLGDEFKEYMDEMISKQAKPQ